MTLSGSEQALLVPPLSATPSLPLPLNDSPEQLNCLLPEVYINTLFPLVANDVRLSWLARPAVIAQNLVQPQIPNLMAVLVIGRFLVLAMSMEFPVAGVQPLTMPTLAQPGALHTTLLRLAQCLNIPARTSTL